MAYDKAVSMADSSKVEHQTTNLEVAGSTPAPQTQVLAENQLDQEQSQD